MKRIVAMLLVVTLMIVSVPRVKATEVVSAGVLAEVVALILSTAGAGFSAYLVEEGFSGDMTREEMAQVVMTNFIIKRIENEYVIENKASGHQYEYSGTIDWDLLNGTMEQIGLSTSSKIISYLDGDVGVSLSSDMKIFLQWWKTNVRLNNNGSYSFRTSSTTMGYSYDTWTVVTRSELLSKIPLSMRDEYLQMTNSIRDMTANISGAYINGQVGVTGTSPVSETWESVGDIDFDNPRNNYASTQYTDYVSYYEYNPTYDEDLLIQRIVYFNNPKINAQTGGLKWGPGSNAPYEVYITDNSVATLYIRYVYPATGIEGENAVSHVNRQVLNPWGTLTNNYPLRAWQVLKSSQSIYHQNTNDLLMVGDTYFPPTAYDVPKVIIPAIAIGETGTAVLGFDDVIDLPIAEDEEGIPYVVDGVPSLTDEDIFGGITEGEVGVVPTTTDGWLAVISGDLVTIKNDINNKNIQNSQMQTGFDDLLSLLYSKLGLFYQLQQFLQAIVGATYSDEKPNFLITFNGEFGIHGQYNIVDFTHYDAYRDYIRLFISAVAWFVFAKKVYNKIPQMLTT